MTDRDALQILGGGPAGLAAAWYAARAGLDATVYEAGSEVGGNCRTLEWGEFRFDTGAHRFHDKDPEVTREVRDLLGEDLVEVHAPSQIVLGERRFDFPLAPYDLFTQLDAGELLRVMRENLRGRLRRPGEATSFEEVALARYGPTLAEMFLLGYSRKLWGAETDRLSPRVAGKRLQGLDLKTFLLEALLGKRRKTTHLDGSFFYPREGIGQIFERVAEEIGPERIRRGARVTRLHHDGERIHSLVLNGEETVEAGTVVSSLPLPLALRVLDPAPPAELLELAGSLRYRHLVLGVLALDRPRLSENASLYFPSPDLPFTRVYESKNRSAALAPAERTSIVVEIPCERDDRWWRMAEEELRESLVSALEKVGLLSRAEVLGFRRMAVPFAYPILEVGFEERAARLREHLERFGNLKLIGRSARFEYTHIHDMFRQGREVVEGHAAQRP